MLLTQDMQTNKAAVLLNIYKTASVYSSVSNLKVISFVDLVFEVKLMTALTLIVRQIYHSPTFDRIKSMCGIILSLKIVVTE